MLSQTRSDGREEEQVPVVASALAFGPTHVGASDSFVTTSYFAARGSNEKDATSALTTEVTPSPHGPRMGAGSGVGEAHYQTPTLVPSALTPGMWSGLGELMDKPESRDAQSTEPHSHEAAPSAVILPAAEPYIVEVARVFDGEPAANAPDPQAQRASTRTYTLFSKRLIR